MSTAKFITLEGIDKTGKTLIWDILKTEFPEYTFITDPPKWDPWDLIFTNGTIYNGKLPPISESFIHLSARLHSYTKKIKISLEKDISVISDRYADSWLAYQAVFNRIYFSDDTASLDFFKKIHDTCIEYGTLINPDITILITADIGIIKRRLKVTENITKYEEDIENLKEVQSNYLKLAKEYPKRYHIIEEKDQGIILIYKEVKKILKKEGIF
jgi:dTMP kinase